MPVNPDFFTLLDLYYMTEQSNQAATPNGPQFEIVRLYLKDVSFEAPNSPAIFTEDWEPKVNFRLDTKANSLENDLFEVVLGITLTVKQGEKTAYLCELQQAGIFMIKEFSDDTQKGFMLGAFCPNTLFPFARECISSLVVKGGFPDFLLAPIDFHTLYLQKTERARTEQVASPNQAADQ